eukprot:gene18235-23906_t
MGNSSTSNKESDYVGYRVLGIQPDSPAEKGGLVSFFDFIIEANEIALTQRDSTFVELIHAFEDKPLSLKVYNWKSKSIRDITLMPSKNWPGEGMLGVTIRFDTYLNAEEHICHVLEVDSNSPAELAGLQPEVDYLLGTTELDFKDVDVLHETLEQNINKPLEVYVYNSNTDEVRTVIIMPNADWGKGPDECGLLGADVAQGYLHILPTHCCQTIGKSVPGIVGVKDYDILHDYTVNSDSIDTITDITNVVTTEPPTS